MQLSLATWQLGGLQAAPLQLPSPPPRRRAGSAASQKRSFFEGASESEQGEGSRGSWRGFVVLASPGLWNRVILRTGSWV